MLVIRQSYRRCLVLGAVAMVAAGLTIGRDQPVHAASPDSAPPLPLTGTIRNVATVSQLMSAISTLQSNDTIVLAAGTYKLTSTLWINGAFSNVTIRGASNNRNDVVLVGKGMGVADGNVPHGIWTGGDVSNLTIANLTIRDIYQHPIILNPGTRAPRLYNVRLVNAGQQFVKANPDGAGGGVDNGVVEYSVMEYEGTAVDYYTNGVDVHTGRDWIIRNNLFRRIRSQSGLAGPAILMWNASSGTVAEGNTFIDCHREIAFGLIERTPNDHTGGIVRNNFIYRNAGMGGDVAIGVMDSPNTKVVHNTIILNGAYPNAIEYRFANTSGVSIVNNLSDSGSQARDGATASLQGNLWTATAALFNNPAAGDLHLKSSATAAIDKGVATSDAPIDWDGQSRPQGAARDIGADEYASSTPPPPPPPTEVCGDGIDNDGDGQIDEGCSTEPPSPPPAEVCGDGIDNDGDGQVDEGCSTAPPAEVCGDGIDNDGDGQIDEACTPQVMVPGAPTRLTQRVSGNRVHLSWLAPITGGAPTGYLVEAGVEPGATSHTLPLGLTTSTSVTDVGTGRYFIRVRAVNAAGQSDPSNEVVASVGCSRRPRRSQLTSSVNGGLVTFSWTDPDGCGGTRYRIQAGSEPGSANLGEITLEGGTATASAPAGTYYARVIAESDFGASEPSNEVQVTVSGACTPPSFTTNLSASVNGRAVTLNWGPANPAAAIAADSVSPIEYRLEVGTAPGTSDVGVFPVGRTTSFTTPAPPGTYYLRARAVDACGAGVASKELVVQVR